MSEQKRYTSQKMREVADMFKSDTDPIAVCFCDKDGWHPNYIECHVEAMLRQAADTEEAINAITGRYEKLKAQCLKICGKSECDNKGSKCIQCAKPVLDFIIRGEGEVAK